MKRIILIIIIFLDVFIFINSKEVIIEFQNTINICLYSLMPTMFYSVFLSNILIINNYIPSFIYKFFYKIFNLSKENTIILFLSIISGYPNNIKLLSNSDNEYFNYVTNYVNPLFFIGTVSTLYIKNNICIIVLISHYISNIILLYIFKNKYNNTKLNNTNIKNKYLYSLKTTINTLSIIFSNLLLISLFVTLLKQVLPFNNTINSFILGILEFSKGIYELSLCNISIYLKGLLVLIIITFGSISIHFQSISLNSKIKYIKFLLFRILNVLISIIIYFILVFIFL